LHVLHHLPFPSCSYRDALAIVSLDLKISIIIYAGVHVIVSVSRKLSDLRVDIVDEGEAGPNHHAVQLTKNSVRQDHHPQRIRSYPSLVRERTLVDIEIGLKTGVPGLAITEQQTEQNTYNGSGRFEVRALCVAVGNQRSAKQAVRVNGRIRWCRNRVGVGARSVGRGGTIGRNRKHAVLITK